MAHLVCSAPIDNTQAEEAWGRREIKERTARVQLRLSDFKGDAPEATIKSDLDGKKDDALIGALVAHLQEKMGATAEVEADPIHRGRMAVTVEGSTEDERAKGLQTEVAGALADFDFGPYTMKERKPASFTPMSRPGQGGFPGRK